MAATMSTFRIYTSSPIEDRWMKGEWQLQVKVNSNW
jgi:hypothetical protein